MNLQYQTVQTAEMKPDLYDGPECNDMRPRWVAESEKEGATEIDGFIKLNPSAFPPGTRVLIQVPMCPNCGLNAEYAENLKCECGFDWNAWVEDKYS
jgi:hypothetical protein